MKKKNIALIVTAALALSAFAGCAAPTSDKSNSSTEGLTAAQIAKGAADALSSATSISTSSELEFSGNFSFGDTSTDLNMTMNTIAETVLDPAASHVLQTMRMSYSDQDYTQSLEFYTVDENGTSYIYTGSDGVWAKSVSDEDIVAANGTVFQKIADGEIDAKLDDETEKINGRDAYEMSLSIAGDYIKDLLGFSLGESLADGLSFSNMVLETEVYVYVDTLEPACVSISCEELGKTLFEKLIGLTGTDFSIDDFDVDFSYNSFNEIDEITVPDDVKAAAEENADASQSEHSDSESSAEVKAIQNKIDSAEDKSSNGDLPIALELNIDSNKLSVPSDYSTMAKLGWTLDTSAGSTVEANNYGLEYMTNGENTLSVYIYNSADTEASYEDCEIIGISVVGSDISNMKVSLPSNITLGSTTLDDVLKACGKPANYYVDDSMIYVFYSSGDSNKILSLYFDFGTEVLNEIEIQDITSVSETLSS